jgi:catalase
VAKRLTTTAGAPIPDKPELVGDLFRLMSPEQQELLMDNIAAAMQGVPEVIQLRQVRHFAQADVAYGAGVATRLGLKLATFSAQIEAAE